MIDIYKLKQLEVINNIFFLLIICITFYFYKKYYLFLKIFANNFIKYEN